MTLGDYRFNRIYRLDAGITDLSFPPDITGSVLGAAPPAAADDRLLERFSYGGENAYGFGLFLEGQLAAICWFWGHLRFQDPLLWHLSSGEAIMVDLVTAPKYRGRGLAPLLIRYAGNEMRRAGMRDLYTWVWHSHHASRRAFEKAGWRQIAWVLETYPFGARRPLRLAWPARRSK